MTAAAVAVPAHGAYRWVPPGAAGNWRGVAGDCGMTGTTGTDWLDDDRAVCGGAGFSIT